ncbi:MAG TPA: hypothetical protein P5511_02335, partial [Candidatus Goldiibacteriota bacterium]|nr:hypothetical protein [Candidatus Goldiibacteriota bacterium]
MKKTVMTVISVLVFCAAAAAADAAYQKGGEVYAKLMNLAQEGFLDNMEGKENFTRAEAAKLAYEASARLLQDQSAKPEVYDIVSGLIKEFQTDLMEKGEPLSAIQQRLIDLAVAGERRAAAELRQRQDDLFGMIGMRINGEASGYMTDVTLYGNKFIASGAKRYNPITQRLDLRFAANSGKQLKAEAVFRLQNLLGALWGAQDSYGLRRLTVTGDFPVYFEIGDYKAKMTPFTIWQEDDDRGLEARVFSDRRDMIKNELWLSDNSWPLSGARIGYKAGDSLPFSLKTEAFAARIAEAGRPDYMVSPDMAIVTTTAFVASYNRFIFGASVESDLSLKDAAKAGIYFTDIRDIKGTGQNQDAAALDNYTASAAAEFRAFDIVTASAEFALSGLKVENAISPEDWHNEYVTDTALKTRLKAEVFDTEIEASFFVVGNSFTAYAAQSRIYDGYNNYPYVTQNNTWNISLAEPAYTLANRVYPFTRYNGSIMVSYAAQGSRFMPYDMFENNSSPYGDATSNRQGVSVRVSGDYLDSMIKPYAKYSFSSEIVSYLPVNQWTCPREFTVAEAGLKAAAFGITAYTSYRFEYSYNGYAGAGGNVDLRTAALNAGIEYTLFEKLRLHGGFKDIGAKGAEYPYSFLSGSWQYLGKTEYDASITAYGFGADYEVSKQASVSFSFSNTLITDRLNENASF